ncbi:ATP-binding protein [Vreelandella utahensis]|uniref:ATP-binding protein n=1 Tax=Vreelandella halophila TaxID=86177 RepID=UPI001C4DE522|nr:ATP-binding protein [Halomonas utahensis]
MLGVTLVAVLAMVVATQYTFQDDFLDYARERQQERVASLAERLADYYADTGGWSALRSPEAWQELLHESVWRLPPPGRRRPDRKEPNHHTPNPKPRHAPPGSFGLRPALLNAVGEPVTGPDLPVGELERVAIRVGGATVGWLAYRPVERITDRIALRFRDQQFEAAWAIAAAVSVLAGMVSLLLARGLLAPVGRLAGATRALAAGRFDTRVQEARRDELGQLARDFNRLAETLERNEQLRREFMADVSHELRTPLSVLRAELEAMEDGVRPLNHESLTGLQRNLAALNKLVEDLYDLSLADAGALAYRMSRLDAVQLVARIAEQWRGSFANAGLELCEELPPQAVMISGDEQRLEQLVANLLRNSLQYTGAGGQVRMALADEGGKAVLSIEDSAPGVAAENRARLFERLYRVEGSRSRASGGAGLGLAICERIAQAHDGDLTAYESPLGGLGIRLRLPLDQRPSTSAEVSA